MLENRPRPLLKSALLHILAAVALGGVLAWITNAVIAVSEHLVAKTLVLLCVGGLLLLWRLQEHHPFDRLGVANQVTLARGVLVILLLSFIGADVTPQLQLASLCLAMMASALDALDGWAARRTNMSSAYGARFDMETDALLILTLSVLAWHFGKVDAWILASGLMRYAFIAASASLPWLRHPLPSSQRRKFVAVVQTVSLVIAIAPFVSRNVSTVVCACALALLTWSFLVDIAWLRRRSSSSVTVT